MNINEFEMVAREGVVVCKVDMHVLAKANDMGVLAELVAKNKGNAVKVVCANEVFHRSNNTTVIDVYALINFMDPTDGGYAYIRIMDLLNNMDKLPFFIEAIENAGGGKFSEAYIKERFIPNTN